MKSSSRFKALGYFFAGLGLLLLGMIIEYLLGGILSSEVMQFLYGNGVLLILLILFFAGGLFLLRRSIFGLWRYKFDSIIFMIAALICLASMIQTVFGLQIGHPYLYLAETNPFLMNFLWIFVLPPLNPMIVACLSGCFFLAAWLNSRFVLVPSTNNKEFSESPAEKPQVPKWRIVANLTRVSVWLGSIFLLILSFIILGGPPLSSPSNIRLYDPINWIYLSWCLVVVCLLNSAVFIINQASDLDTDQRHEEKALLLVSAGYIKGNRARQLAGILIIIGFCLAILTKSVYFTLLMICIPLFGILYSLPPIRVKSRPFLDLVIIGIAFGTWTVLTAWSILSIWPDPFIGSTIPVVLLFGPGIFYAGTHCIHTVSDYQADSEAGLNTTAVYIGPKKAANLGITLIAIGLLLLYVAVGYYTHLFWYGLLKYKGIFLLIFCGLPFFTLLEQFRMWQQLKQPNHSIIHRLQKQGRLVTYLLFLILLIYLLLNVFLFYPVYYPSYDFPWV